MTLIRSRLVSCTCSLMTTLWPQLWTKTIMPNLWMRLKLAEMRIKFCSTGLMAVTQSVPSFWKTIAHKMTRDMRTPQLSIWLRVESTKMYTIHQASQEVSRCKKVSWSLSRRGGVAWQMLRANTMRRIRYRRMLIIRMTRRKRRRRSWTSETCSTWAARLMRLPRLTFACKRRIRLILSITIRLWITRLFRVIHLRGLLLWLRCHQTSDWLD